MPGVQEVIQVSKPYKLVSRDVKEENTVIRFPGSAATIGGTGLAIVAGPCSIESREQAFTVAERVAKAGARFFRGGAYKPRTSPYDFQGLGLEALRLLREVRDEVGLPVVTEVMSTNDIELISTYADMLQVGARNMQNYDLLKAVGKTGKPTLLKRGFSATIEETLSSAEYLLSEGNPNVIICERGIKTFESEMTRNTLDLAAVALVRELSHLPVIADPSHGTGKRELIAPASRAALAIGADGLIIEVHPCPERALSDGAQSLNLEEFAKLMKGLCAPIRPVATADSLATANGR